MYLINGQHLLTKDWGGNPPLIIMSTKKVIDVYFSGINGFTYSWTYPDMVSATGAEDVKDIINMDDEGTHDIYVTRDLDTSKEDFPTAKGMYSEKAEQSLNNANLTF